MGSYSTVISFTVEIEAKNEKEADVILNQWLDGVAEDGTPPNVIWDNVNYPDLNFVSEWAY